MNVFVSEWDLTVEIPQTWHSAINNNSDQKCVAIPCNSVPHPERDIQFHWYCAIIGVAFFLPAPIPPCIECFSPISKKVQDSIWTRLDKQMLKKYKRGEKAPENKDMKIYMFWIYFPTYVIVAHMKVYTGIPGSPTQ